MERPMTVLATMDEAKKIRWPEDSGGAWVVVLVAVLLAALAALGVFIVRRLVLLSRAPQPGRALFDELADAHRLTPPERKILLTLARRENLDDPARLFVDPGYLKSWSASGAHPVLRPLFERLFERN